jgi:HPt (histidine-containing phosphotransfer) domain-containing protein
MHSQIELRSTRSLDNADETELPLIDQSIMSDWCNDLEKEDVLAILSSVPDEVKRSLADLRKAVGARDLASARRTAHRLKGMANNLGAVRLGRMARDIELTSHSIEDVSARLATLEQTMGKTLEALRSYC